MADYNIQQLGNALKKAHAAGDVAAARRIAQEIKKIQGGAPASPEGGGMLQTADDAMRILGNSVTFNLADKIAAMGDVGPIDYFGPQGDEALAKQRALTDQARSRIREQGGGTWATVPEAVPLIGGAEIGADTAVDIVGGTALGGGLAKNGVSLLTNASAKTAGPLTRIGRAATEAGAYNAAYNAGATDTGEIPDYLWNAGLGFTQGAALGAGLGAAGVGVQGAAQRATQIGRKVTGRARETDGMSTIARREVGDALRRDQTTPQNATRYGPETMLPDTGMAAQEILRGSVQHNSPATIKTREALKTRQEGRSARLQQDVDAGLGPATFTPMEIRENLKAQRQAITPDLQIIFQSAPPVAGVRGVAAVIDSMLKTAEGKQAYALNKIRDSLVETPAKAAVPDKRVRVIDPQTGKFIRWQVVPGTPAKPEVLKTNFENLHNIKVMIDNMIDFGDATIKPGELAQAEGAAKRIRRILADELKNTDRRYEVEMNRSRAIAKQLEGLDIGYDSLKKGDRPMRTDELADKQANPATPGRREAIKLGQRHFIEDQIGSGEELSKLKGIMGGSDFTYNRAKVEQVQGRPFRERMEKAIEREEVFTASNQAGQGGSQTSRNMLTALGFLGDTFPNRVIRAIDIPARVIEWAIEKTAGLRGERLRDELARISGLKGPALEKLVREIQRREAITGRVNQSIQTAIPGLLAADGATHTANEME